MAGFDMQFSAPGIGDDARALERDLLRFVGEIDDDAVRDTATALARGVSEGFRRLYAVAVAQTEFQRALREAGVTDAVRDSVRAWRQTRQASFAPSAHDLDRFLAATDGLLHILQQRPSALAGTHAELEVDFMARVVGNLRDYGLNWYAYSSVEPTGAEYNATEIRRDARMADNIRWLAERMYPDRKLIVWAHNGHILNAHYGPDFTGITSQPVDGGLKRMGAYVAETFGQAVYTIAFIAFSGEYGSARTPGRSPIGNMPADGIEAMLHELGHSDAFLDFRGLPSEHWLRQPATMATLNYRPEISDDWTRIFDGVFFIDRMTAARPIDAHVHLTQHQSVRDSASLDTYIRPFTLVDPRLRLPSEQTTRDLVDALVTRGLPVTSTLSAALLFSGGMPVEPAFDPESGLRSVLVSAAAFVARLAEAGVQVIVGTDWCPCALQYFTDPPSALQPGAVTHAELEMLSWGGLSEHVERWRLTRSTTGEAQ